MKNEVNTMLYTVLEVANKLHVSKQAIYGKLKLSDYKDKTIMKHGQTMIGEELVNLIKDNLKITNKFTDTSIQETIENQINAESAMDDDESVNINQELLTMLKEQLKVKDNQLKQKNEQMEKKDLQFTNQLIAKDIQINNYSERLKQAHKLIENNQILLKEKPKQELMLLEEHFQELDSKLMDIKQDMQERKEPQKGLFKRIFRK